MAQEDLFNIALLIDELKNEDAALRLNSVKHIDTIARALGPERTASELVPFLEECTDDDDEVLVELASQLTNFVDLCGGPSKAHVLLKSLDALCTVEEQSVREKATQALNNVIRVMPLELFNEHMLPMLHSMANADSFTTRESACAVFAEAYARVVEPATMASLRDLYGKVLCCDETPMVRRAAASNLGPLCKKCPKEIVKGELMLVFQNLSKDDQDSVRFLAVPNSIAIGSMLLPSESNELILPIVHACAQDRSWRVRYMVAQHFPGLCDVVGADITKAELVPAFIRLLKDQEGEVRKAGATNVHGVCSFIPKDAALKLVMPCVNALVSDSNQHVRAALAKVIMGLAPIFGKEDTQQHLLELFLLLLKDEFPDVRLNIIAKLDDVNKVIGIDLLSQSLLPAIVELAEDKNWRVRLRIIEQIPLLAAQLGVEFFDDKLGNLCMTWLGDAVYTVREAATKNLQQLTLVFGVEWARHHVIPKILALQSHPNYLYRMTTLFAITGLAEAGGSECLTSTLTPLILKMATDSVPNIRFNVAKSIGEMLGLVDENALRTLLRPCLQKLSEDPDKDVKFFATEILIRCDAAKS